MNKILTYSFVDNYIEKLVDHIEENYLQKNADLSRLAIVFGGKRPALFVKRELARRLKKTFVPPKFFTIDEFISSIVVQKESRAQATDLDNCYLLYALAKEVAPDILKGRESFAQFLPWTREIIKFIEHLDLEMVDDKALLNVEANADIGYAVPEDINKLLSQIVTIKKAYHEKLKSAKVYSRGYEYWRASQLIDQCPFDEFDQIIFCNFFYFHKTEERIVRSLYERGKATLIFQGDERKWPVLKRISQKFNFSLKEGDEPDKPAFDLKLYRGFDTHSQVALVREILKGIKDLDQTVIVLPHTETLVPLLSEMTSHVKEFNISMGYPLKRSSFYTLFEFIFKAQNSKKGDRYYSRDYLKALRHPFVKNLKLGEDVVLTRTLVHKIEEILTGKAAAPIAGSSFITLDEIEESEELIDCAKEMCERLEIKARKKDLKDILRELHALLFHQWEGAANFKEFAASLETFLDAFTSKSFLKSYPLNLNIAEKMYAIKDELMNASFALEPFAREEMFRIFDSKVTSEKVSFVGSPLKGLQVLGLFETRSLNFKNVIVIDTNEGVLPSLKIYEPLIPREVMISLQLNRLELEEEIQRYQFMRLISSAKNVHLVYQEARDKEKSRFVEELIWQEQKETGQLAAIVPIEASFDVKVSTVKKSIPKTPAMIEALKKHTYSASSINTYLRDPLEFYHQYVLGLKEQDDLLDEPEARHVGTFIHKLLEEAYKPYLNKHPTINAKFRKRFEKLFNEMFDQAFGRAMKSDAFLLRSVLVDRLNRFLDKEALEDARSIDTLLFLEHAFDDTIKLSCGEIRFKYVIDRVERLKDGTVMVIDYKTGAIDQMPKKFKSISGMELSRDNIFENVRSLQIPMYFQYLQKQFKGGRVNAALYNLRTLTLKPFLSDKDAENIDEINREFLRCLDFIVSEILDPNVPFEEGEDIY